MGAARTDSVAGLDAAAALAADSTDPTTAELAAEVAELERQIALRQRAAALRGQLAAAGAVGAPVSPDHPAVLLQLPTGAWSAQVLKRTVADEHDNRAAVPHLVMQPITGGLVDPVTGYRQPTSAQWHRLESAVSAQLQAQYPELAQLVSGAS